MKGETVAIIGAGKVGTALGSLLRSAGYTVAALADPSPEALDRGIRYTGGKPFADAAEAAALADIVFITTVDDAIRTTCDYLAEMNVPGPGKRVLHTSGAGGLDLLQSALIRGASVASIHPLQTFADIESGIRTMPGSTFAVTAEGETRDWAVKVVADLGGVPFFVADEDKPLYHAAACFASNYLVSLMKIVVSLYGSLGLSREEALRAVWPLVEGTVGNIRDRGVEASLTGPIARGDIQTIREHLRVLSKKTPEFLELYRLLGLTALKTALENGTVSWDRARELEGLLKGDREHE